MRRVNRFFRTVAIGLMTLGAPAQATSLADALATAYSHSNLLDQNRALLRATDEGLEQSLAALGPVVEFVTQALSNSDRAPDYRLSVALQASLTLYDFGRGQLSVQAANEQILATRAALIGVEQAVLLEAVRAYMDLFSKIQAVQLQHNNLRVITEQRRAAQQRFELGDSTRTDVALADARLAAARLALTAAEGDVAVAREVYRLSVGHYPNGLSTPPNLPRLPATQTEAAAIARRQHPSILQAQHQVAAADIAREIAENQRFGTVTGSLSAEARTQSSSGIGVSGADLTASIRWGVPVYTSGRLSSVERQTLAQSEAARAALHQTVAVIQQNVAVTWSRLAVARAQLSTSDLQISAAQAALDAVRAEAELGSRTTLDVLDAEQDVLDARTAQIQALASLHLAAYALLESTGQLTVRSLNLGVPTYDVDAYTRQIREQRSPLVPSVQGRQLDRIMSRYAD